MYLPTEFSTKLAMLLFIKSKGQKTAKQIAKCINANPLSSHEICQLDSLDDLLAGLKHVEKDILWVELCKACPELLEDDCDDEIEDHDCEEEDDEE